ncbi:hypothetical protein [Streptomyces jumonjinensis]|uniref:DUF4279 domain-containing protein n=1 Tax=Streptomyces jumonjinensis TaxID=1945 RepID=A0A646KJQ1_STRJU|nr:hypothetical protein [Streptomyces jumonjinensis]MQT01286.1 hypothetical protein [Streptomyces jumonjinensis]
MNSPEYWTDVYTSLAITNADMDIDFVNDSLGLSGVPSDAPGPFVTTGPGWWAFTFDEQLAQDLDGQIAALVSQVAPRLDGVQRLREAGYAIQVAIAGTVESRAALYMTPEAASLLATLGLPVSFTTLTALGRPQEDPMAWLDD